MLRLLSSSHAQGHLMKLILNHPILIYNDGGAGGDTRPPPRDRDVEELHGDPTVWTLDQFKMVVALHRSNKNKLRNTCWLSLLAVSRHNFSKQSC